VQERGLRFCHLPLLLIAIHKITQDEDRLSVMGTELLLADRERPLVERFSLHILALFVIEDCQIIQAGSQVKVVGWKVPLTDDQDTSQQWPSWCDPSLVQITSSEIVQADRCLKVVAA